VLDVTPYKGGALGKKFISIMGKGVFMGKEGGRTSRDPYFNEERMVLGGRAPPALEGRKKLSEKECGRCKRGLTLRETRNKSPRTLSPPEESLRGGEQQHAPSRGKKRGVKEPSEEKERKRRL